MGMTYNTLGDSNIKVSRICLGTMTWGKQNTEAEAHAQIDQALAAGVNFLDTAEMYPVPPEADTQGLTETYIGNWLKQSGKRDDVVIATKVAGPAPWLPWIREGKTQFRREHLRAALEGSLKRLQTDHIDLYQLHWPERNTNYFGELGFAVKDEAKTTDLLETLQALGDLVREGKIRSIGLSNESPWGLMRCLSIAANEGLPKPVTVQNPYNLLNRTYEIGMAECSFRENVGLLAYSPLSFGALTGKYLQGKRPKDARLTLFKRFSRYTSDHAEEAIAKYVALAQAAALDPAQMALAYVNRCAYLTSNIIGATTTQQLATNLASIDVDLNDEVLQGIEAIHQERTNPCP